MYEYILSFTCIHTCLYLCCSPTVMKMKVNSIVWRTLRRVHRRRRVESHTTASKTKVNNKNTKKITTKPNVKPKQQKCGTEAAAEGAESRIGLIAVRWSARR